MTAYLLFTTIFDVSRTRTLWLRGHSATLTKVFTVATVCKFAILLLETVEKRRILRPGYSDYPPEATSGTISRSFFWWLNPLFRSGFSKTLAVNDLFTLDNELRSETLHESMQTAWDEGSLSLLYVLCVESDF